jgi:hypothetical protein
MLHYQRIGRDRPRNGRAFWPTGRGGC